MSQSPPGGFPPPDEPHDAGDQSGPPTGGNASTGPELSAPPPGAYPPPPAGPPPGYQGGAPNLQKGQPPGYQDQPQGPPPGYQPGPPPGYQGPPPGYQQGPPPGYQQGPPPGYQQGPPPGYQPPPPGYQGQQSPVQGGYAAPPPGYGPPPGYPPQGASGGYGPPGASGYPPPAGYPATGGGAPKPAFDVATVSIAGWGVLGAALLTLIASFFSFWHVTVTGIASVGLNGWSLWWWIPVLLAVAVGVVYALQLFGVINSSQVKPEWLVYAAGASFVLMIIVLLQTFFYGGGTSSLFGDTGISYGPSFGVFLALVTTAALTYFTALAAQNSGAKLPIKVPGPA